MNSELRSLRSENERIQREQRAAANAANAARVTHFTVAPTPPTAPPTTAHTQYYRPYPIYGTQQAYGNPAANATTVTFPVTPVHQPVYHPPTPQYQGTAIPVQLPVSSLPALHSLGIIPVPTASLPPEGQPQPPAILRGSSTDGTTLSLEINVSLLKSHQMSGLAAILNTLVAKNNGLQQQSAAAVAAPMPKPGEAS